MPLALSTAHGCTAAIAPPTFSARSPPLRINGTREERALTRAQSKLSPVPPRSPRRALARETGIEQMEVDVEALEVAHVTGARDLRGLDDPGPGSSCSLCAERWPLVAVQLQQVRPSSSLVLRTSCSGALTNTPHSSVRLRRAAQIICACSIEQLRGLRS